MPKSRRKPSSGVPAGAGKENARPREIRKTRSIHLALVCLLLTAITIIPYSRLIRCDFVIYDDPRCVTENPNIQELGTRSILWAFNIGYNSNWHPLTWMSHMLDYRLWGMNAAGHHATNLLLHVVSALLLFLIFRRMTQSVWRSFLVAALFAVHPLHVESVAWIAERKDVLSTAFWMLTIGAYIRYLDRPGTKRYLGVVILYALGLMAKPMLVSLPFVLLMLDYWPLGRWRLGDNKGPGVRRLVVEKAPLLIMAAASGVLTIIAQRMGEATSSLEALSVGARVSNAAVSYFGYIAKMVWPLNLAVFYPHPINTLPDWRIGISASVLILVTLFVVRQSRRRPYLMVGWGWYLITLIPVIGLVQVGAQAMADRYTYIPLIGLFIAAVWSIPGFAIETERRGDGEMGRWGERMPIAGQVAACLVIAALAVITWVQVGYWRNSIVLFEHALRVVPNSYPVHANLGKAYANKGNYEAAIPQYEKALAMRQDEAHVFCDYGDALAKLSRVQEAVPQYHKALQVDPKLTQAQDRLDAIEQSQSEAARAEELLRRLSANPHSASAHINRGVIFASQGKTDEAIREYKEAIRLNPNLAATYNNLAVLYDNLGRRKEAIRVYRNAIRIKPDFFQAHGNLAVALYLDKDYAGALKEIELCRRYGGTPSPKLVQALAKEMPDPEK